MGQLIFNLLGYFSAPIVSAAVMDAFDDELEGMIWGFRLILWWGFFGFFFMVLAYIAASFRFSVSLFT